MKFAVYLAALTALLPATGSLAKDYELVLAREKLEVVPGRRDTVMSINGGVPGPTLRLSEGEDVAIRVVNRTGQTAAIHWHGLLLHGSQDGAPGFNGFPGIAPGATYTYRFKLRQSGTYWYHAHSGTQEQAGQYGALIIAPAAPDPIHADREQVVLLSEHTPENPERIIRNLKGDSGYYNWSKRTTPELFRDIAKFGLKKTLAERRAWADMRMEATDIADVTNYTLLVNGKPSAAKPWMQFNPGETVRLRFVNGSAMSFMDVRIPGLTMTVVAADGRPVEPVEVDEFRMGVAETYDVLVKPKDAAAYPLWVETIDRKASVLASLAPEPGMAVAKPPHRPRQVLLLSEMGHSMDGMSGMGGMAGHDMAGMTMVSATGDASCPPEHAAMGHCKPSAAAPAAGAGGMADMSGMTDMAGTGASAAAPAADPSCPPEHAAMGHCKPKAASLPPAAPPAADPSCPPEHAAMGHCKPKAGAPAALPASNGARQGTAVAAATPPPADTPFPVVDYGYGRDAMAGMDHGAMGHGGMAMPVLGREGDTDGSGRVFGWASGAPYGARVLSMRDLVAAVPNTDTRPPTREITVRIQGNMERYIWTLNGAKFGEAPPIRVRYGERVRITFVNETMMAHPMHLHGMFFAVDNGQPLERMPQKNVTVVAPGRTQSIILTADEPGEWPLHCHLLYHMETGMMQKLVVASVDQPDGSPAPSAPHVH